MRRLHLPEAPPTFVTSSASPNDFISQRILIWRFYLISRFQFSNIFPKNFLFCALLYSWGHFSSSYFRFNLGLIPHLSLSETHTSNFIKRCWFFPSSKLFCFEMNVFKLHPIFTTPIGLIFLPPVHLEPLTSPRIQIPIGTMHYHVAYTC